MEINEIPLTGFSGGLDWSQDFNVKLNTGVSSYFHFSLETNTRTLR